MEAEGGSRGILTCAWGSGPCFSGRARLEGLPPVTAVRGKYHVLAMCFQIPKTAQGNRSGGLVKAHTNRNTRGA